MTDRPKVDDTAPGQSPLQRAVAALAKMKARLEEVERAASEPVAIIGMGCRFPGGGGDPAAFWRALLQGTDGVREIPEERWPRDAIPGAPPETRWAGLLDDVDAFDTGFFGIAPREAESLDPQQRLLLEIAWETLEDAGQRPSSLEGGRVGVYVGITTLDYRERVRDGRAGSFDAYCTTGNLMATAAGRLSYVLGLRGPALAVDTACSSSLVTVHLACQSLRARECELALAGGVNLLLSPAGMAMAAATTALSPDGRCRTLDARANGFVRGEGCGLVALKRLRDAQRDGDRILSVILGSAVNQDGRSTGLTAPNVLAQEDLIRRALESARLSPADIGYVEMHGTGTPLGDPIELEALRAVLGEPRPDGSPCLLGSVKTNVGHLESAAGVAGLIKVVQSLRHGLVPRNLHFRTLNPRVSLRGTPFAVPIESTPWQAEGKPRRAGVSSFGISGTNAHVVLEEPPSEPRAEPAADAPPYLLPLSAKSADALVARAAQLGELLRTEGTGGLGDILYTASVRRDHHRHRLAVVGESREELSSVLSAVGRGESVERAARGEAPMSGRPRVVLVVPGQGSQWEGMGRQLLAGEPVFREALEACDAALVRESGFSVLGELRAGSGASRLGEIGVVQPVLFAMAVGLGALWRSWGVVPDVVVGHSMGEVAAAHLAGILSLEDAAKVICRRSKLLSRRRGRGAMAQVELPASEAEVLLRGRESRLSVAVINGPRSTVLSGEPEALEEVLSSLERQGVFCRRVKVDVASHSPQMDELSPELLSLLSEVKPQRAQVPMVSTVTGEPVTGPELTAEYWVQNLRRPVLFSSAVKRIVGETPSLFVELSPHPLLLPSILENLSEAGREGAALASTRRERDERRSLRESLAELYVRGVDVDWARVSPGGRVVSLPPYPWRRERHGLPLPAAGHAALGVPRGGHPLIGHVLVPSDRPGSQYWEQWLDLTELPYLADHRVQGAIMFPATGYIEMAVAAAHHAFQRARFVLENVSFEQALRLTPGEPVHVQVAVVGEDAVQAAISISSSDGGGSRWTRHARLTARAAIAEDVPWLSIPEVMERCPEIVEPSVHHARMVERKIEYGPAFQGLVQTRLGEGESLGFVRLPEAAGAAGDYHLHPALFDACLQVSAVLLGPASARETWVPVAVERLELHEAIPPEVWVFAQVVPGTYDDGFVPVDLVISDEEGRPLVDVQRLWLQRFARMELPDPFSDCMYSTEWIRSEPATGGGEETERKGTWLLFVDDGGEGREAAELLRGAGHRCVEVTRGARFHAVDRDHYTVDPGAPEDFRRLHQEGIDAGGEPLLGVVHLWSLDSAPLEDTTPETILEDLRAGSLGVLHAAQALLRSGYRNLPRLVLVTRGAQPAGGDAAVVSPAQASLWGFARVLSMEHPELGCARIDLDPAATGGQAALLVRELHLHDGEDQIALRGTERFAARLGRHALQAAETLVLREDGTYLITGGLTGLGLSLARFLVRQGARHLVLLARRPPSPEANDAIAEMEQQGARVVARSVDVADPEALSRVLAWVRSSLPALRGVVHSAAALEDRSIMEMTERTFWPPIVPKAIGANNLHQLLRDDPLDFFVLFSSFAGLVGSPGQANYAAANAFMDALSHARRAAGLPSTSIQWGPFSDVGLAAASENRGQRLSLRGIHSFAPEEGNRLFARVLSRPPAEVGLVRMNVRQMFDFYPRMVLAPYFERVRKDDAEAAARPAPDARFRGQLLATPARERRPSLERHVLEHVEKVLRLPADRIDPQGPFVSYGMDSLMSLEIRHRLEASLGIRLSAAVLYTYPNVAALVDHLMTEMDLSAEDTPVSSEDDPGPGIWDEVSVNTAAAMLDEKLLSLEDYLK